MQRLFFFFILFLSISSSLFAQSKKQLLERIEALEAKQQSDSIRWASELSVQQNLNLQLTQENKKLKEENAAQQDAYSALQNNQQGILEKARSRVEVYDLYSFGFVPLRNSVNQYGRTILQMRDEINRQRWADVEMLSIQLRSPYVSAEQKTSLFTQFKAVYGNGLANYTIKDFQQHPLPDQLQKNVKNVIQLKTKDELAQSLLENLWIQSLDPLWRDEALLFIPQIKAWLNN